MDEVHFVIDKLYWYPENLLDFFDVLVKKEYVRQLIAISIEDDDVKLLDFLVKANRGKIEYLLQFENIYLCPAITKYVLMHRIRVNLPKKICSVAEQRIIINVFSDLRASLIKVGVLHCVVVSIICIYLQDWENVYPCLINC